MDADKYLPKVCTYFLSTYLVLCTWCVHGYLATMDVTTTPLLHKTHKR